MPPVAIAAGIAGAATIGGAVLSSRSQRRAGNQAADIAADNSAANNALTREIYGQNAARLDPYAAGGMRAGNALQGLLGVNNYPTGAATGGALGGGQDWSAYLAANPDVAAEANRVVRSGEFASPTDYAAWHYQHYGQGEGRAVSALGGTPATGAGGVTANPQSAWDTFRNSTNYQWRFGQGQKALELSSLPGGSFDSGQTRKATIEYGQNFASNELGAYMDRLAQQQQLGLAGASALAGVSQNMVGAVTANNNASAGAAANAALNAGQARSNMWGGIASGIGTAVGALGGGGSLYGH